MRRTLLCGSISTAVSAQSAGAANGKATAGVVSTALTATAALSAAATAAVAAALRAGAFEERQSWWSLYGVWCATAGDAQIFSTPCWHLRSHVGRAAAAMEAAHGSSSRKQHTAITWGCGLLRLAAVAAAGKQPWMINSRPLSAGCRATLQQRTVTSRLQLDRQRIAFSVSTASAGWSVWLR